MAGQDITVPELGAIAYAMHAVVTSARRCLFALELPRDPSFRVVCERPATWRGPPVAGGRIYTCDVCALMYGTPDGSERAPHADVVMRFMAPFTLGTDGPPPETRRRTLRAFLKQQVVDLAESLLHALPPCPQPLSSTTACPRCATAVARIKPEPFASWLLAGA